MFLKKILLILLISVITISLPYKALGSDLALYLSKDAVSPYSGILLPEEALQSLRKDLLTSQLDVTSLNKSVELYKANEELYTTKVNTLQTQNNALAEHLYSAQSMSTWERVGYFALGSVLTGLVSYGIYKTALAR